MPQDNGIVVTNLFCKDFRRKYKTLKAKSENIKQYKSILDEE